MGMKFKVIFLTLLIAGLMLGAGSAFAALTVADHVDASGTISPGGSAVIATFKVTSGAADESLDQIAFQGALGTFTDADIASVAVYQDINNNQIHDAYDILLGDVITDVSTAGAGPASWNGADVTIDHDDIAFGASGTVKYFIVVATLKAQALAAPTTADGVATLGIDNLDVKIAGGALTAVNVAPATAATAAIVATKLSFVTANVNLQVVTGATLLGGDDVILLEAVDDYGNRDLGYNGEVQFKAESYLTGTVLSGLTADLGDGAGGAGDGGELDVTVGNAGDDAAPLVAGVLNMDTNDSAGAGIEELVVAGNAGAVTIVAVAFNSDATADDFGLEGSVTVYNDAYPAAVPAVATQRGVEFYDTNHNGKFDRATIFFNIPVSLNVAANADFEVGDYVLTGTPAIAVDNGGYGVRNAGEMGVTVYLTEEDDYNTGVISEFTYDSTNSQIQDNGGANDAGTIAAGDATEKDKAIPVIVDARTVDNGAGPHTANNGKVDGIQITFSEEVDGVTADATRRTPAQVANFAGALVLRLTNQDGVNTRITGLSTAIEQDGNVYTIPVNQENSSVNTDAVPVIMSKYNNNNYAIYDNVGQRLNLDVTDWIEDEVDTINVDDKVKPVVVSVTTNEVEATADGKIDMISVVYSEAINEAYGDVSFTDAVFGNYTITAASRQSNTEINYTVSEHETMYDTEATPSVKYNEDGDSNLLDKAGNELYEYAGSETTYTKTDNAKPVVVKVTGLDAMTAWDSGTDAYTTGVPDSYKTGADGRLDAVQITYSEKVSTDARDDEGETEAERDLAMNQFTVDHEDDGGIGNSAGTITDGGTYEFFDKATGGTYDADAVPTWVDDSSDDTSSVITIYFQSITENNLEDADLTQNAAGKSRNGGDTGVILDLVYAKGLAADRIKDMAGLEADGLATLPAGISVDTALPYVMSIQTRDMYNEVNDGEDLGNGDGYIDSFLFEMSEISGIADAESVGGFTIDTEGDDDGDNTISPYGFDSDDSIEAYDSHGVVSDEIDDDDDYEDDATGQNFSYGGAGSADVILFATNAKENDPDTDSTPDFNYDGTNLILDTAENAMDEFSDMTAVDTAKPVIVQAVGLVDSKKIYVTFSEPVGVDTNNDLSLIDGADDTDADDINALFDEDEAIAGNTYFKYDDRNDGETGDSASSIAITDVEQTQADNFEKLTIWVDEDLTVEDVESDFIWVYDADIADAVGNDIIWDDDGKNDGEEVDTLSIMITIDDRIRPYVVDAWTVDYDNDGWIDHIKLKLKDEDINVEAFGDLWVDEVKLNDKQKPAGADGYADEMFDATGWDIAGFTGEKWDFTFHGTATDAGAVGELWDPADPFYVYISVDENNGVTTNTFTGVGDTDQHPDIDSAAATFPKDYKGNEYTNDPENDVVIDADEGSNITWALDDVGAVIMDGKFSTAQQARFHLSEKIDTESWANTNVFSSAFLLYVGTNLSDAWTGTVKDIEQTEDGWIRLDWTDDSDITAGNGGHIEWIAGSWKDLALARDGDAEDQQNLNIASEDLVVLDKWMGGEGGDGDPFVNLIAPNGGEVVNVGDTVKVVWSEADLGTNATVDVLVSLDGVTYDFAAADANDLAPGTNVYDWVPTEDQIGNVWVKVVSSDGGEDFSFQTVKVDPEITGPAPVLTVLDPNGNDEFVYSEDLEITVNWSSANFAAGSTVKVYYQADGGSWTEMVDPDPAAVAAAAAQAIADDDQEVADDAQDEYLAAKAVYDAGYDELHAIAVAAAVASAADPTDRDLAAASTEAWDAVGDYEDENEPELLALLADYESAQADADVTQATADSLWALVPPTDPIYVADGTFEWIPSSSAIVGANLKVKVVSGDTSDMSDQVFHITDGSGSTGEVVYDIAAPSNLSLVDVPGDQGGWFYATFEVSEDNDVVNSYQFYRETALNDADPNDMRWVLFAEVGKGIETAGKQTVLVSFPVNGEATYGVAASSGEVVSTVGLKAGDVPVATLVDGAARTADGVLVSDLATAVGGPVDNIAPAAVTELAANDNAGTASGILVSWTASVDDAIVATYGASGQFPIYGVNEYAIFRDGELVGTVDRGVTSFVDAVEDGVTAYQYVVKSVDDSGIDVASGIKSAIATSDLTGDLNGDSMVDLSDFAIFGANYGSLEADAPDSYIWAYDFNADGTIDLSDFAIFGANYGRTIEAAKGVVAELPTADVMMAMNGEYDATTSTYKLHVNIGQDIDGFDFMLSYDTNNLEFTGDVTGLNGLPFASETEEGVVNIANVFAGEKFNGTVTLSFNTLSDYDDMVFTIDNAVVVNGFDLAKVTDIADFEAKPVPTVYTLSQNFPNPFNPTTTIGYAIPASGHVELAIYNTAGQKVRTLVSNEQSAGFYKMVWDGRNEMGESVASGVYIYRLNSGSFSKTAKMNLIK